MRQIMILLLCLTGMTVSAQRINRDFHNVSLSDALKYIQSQTTNYDLVFIYDELEDFRVTTHVQHKSVPDAIQQIVGFYPVRVVKSNDHEIYVECTHKTARRLTGTIIDEEGLPLPYANVALLSPQDSTLLSGGVSNESGYFAIPYETERVLARISYVGYKTIYRLCNNSEVGTIKMQPDNLTLKGVVVSCRTISRALRSSHSQVLDMMLRLMQSSLSALNGQQVKVWVWNCHHGLAVGVVMPITSESI